MRLPIPSLATRSPTDGPELLDSPPQALATPANRDFVDERLGKVRVERRRLEARLGDLERLDYRPVDVEAVTREALAYVGRFREVLGQGSLEQRKDFLRGFVKEIRIDPDKGEGAINYYRLPVSSLMMVPEARVEPLENPGSGLPDRFRLPGEAWKRAA